MQIELCKNYRGQRKRFSSGYVEQISIYPELNLFNLCGFIFKLHELDVLEQFA